MLPQNGLIIDVRGNPGGNINSAEEILQTLTPHLIEGESAEFLNSPLNLAICNLNKAAGTAEDLSAWVDSMNLALMTGSAMSARFPLSSSEDCNRIGQKYFGPVILIVDALSYSAADIFAAGFQDHKIGTVLGTHSTTGAGGASKINHEDLMNVLAGGGCGYSKLPGGVGMSVALRRTLRVGKRAGLPLEDFGVKPKKHYLMTRNDLLYGNVDLIDKAIELLVALKYKRTQINVIRKLIPGTGYRINIKTRGITRIDVFLLDHPFNSFNLRHGKIEFNIPMPVSQTPTLEIRGFYKDKLVARYRDSFH
jgi:hypothetical protein